jgi:hypothetical protein
MTTSPQIVYPAHWLAEQSADAIRAGASRILGVVRRQELCGGKPLTGLDWCRVGLEVAGEEVPDDARQVTRAALSSAEVTTAFSAAVNLLFLDAYGRTPNTLADVVTPAMVENFLPATAISLWQSGRLTAAGKSQANSLFFGLAGQPWGIARFSTTWLVGTTFVGPGPGRDLSGHSLAGRQNSCGP